MKKRWIAIALLTVLLMGIGGAIGKVGVRQESGGSAYALYFVERDLRSPMAETPSGPRSGH